MPTTQEFHYGIGRRKQASAQARIMSGKGSVTVNDKPAAEYFGHELLHQRPLQPLIELSKEKHFDISLKVRGGGKSGQADAAKLAVANALVAMDKELRGTLKKAGLLKRDARVKERKKYGLKRARKAPQFTKR